MVVLDADNLHIDALRRAVMRVFPEAIVLRADTAREVSTMLSAQPIWLLITSLDIPGADVLHLLLQDEWIHQRADHLMVVTSRREQRILLLLSSLALNGLFDPATEGIDRFRFALRTIAEGRRYLSPRVVDDLIRWKMSPSSIGRVLTNKEQLIFSVIGDGRDDQAAAQALHLSPSTIQSTRRNIHRKLGLSHKGELVRFAVQHGFVQFTADSVLQPAYACPLGRAAGRSQPGDHLTASP